MAKNVTKNMCIIEINDDFFSNRAEKQLKSGKQYRIVCFPTVLGTIF